MKPNIPSIFGISLTILALTFNSGCERIDEREIKESIVEHYRDKEYSGGWKFSDAQVANFSQGTFAGEIELTRDNQRASLAIEGVYGESAPDNSLWVANYKSDDYESFDARNVALKLLNRAADFSALQEPVKVLDFEVVHLDAKSMNGIASYSIGAREVSGEAKFERVGDSSYRILACDSFFTASDIERFYRENYFDKKQVMDEVIKNMGYHVTINNESNTYDVVISEKGAPWSIRTSGRINLTPFSPAPAEEKPNYISNRTGGRYYFAEINELRIVPKDNSQIDVFADPKSAHTISGRVVNKEKQPIKKVEFFLIYKNEGKEINSSVIKLEQHEVFYPETPKAFKANIKLEQPFATFDNYFLEVLSAEFVETPD